MRRILSLVAFFATLQASAQQVNPVPDYVFRNQMSVGRGTVTDTAAYFSIGPRYGANKGFMPPIVGDTATFSSGKRNGLLIFSVQKNKFLYWDSVRVQWSDMAGSSGSYITGSGITGYLPQFSASTTLDTSALFTLGNRLGIGSSTFAYNSTNTANVELNGTAGGILGFKRNDSARGYLWHTGDNMELANTAAGSIFFNTNSATRGSISSAGVWRLHNLAGTGDRVVVASSNGTLSAASSATALVDTTTISTRAWRQKGLDSLAALEVSGSGTTNYIPKFTAGSTIGNSLIFDNGSRIGVNTATPDAGTILHTARGSNGTVATFGIQGLTINPRIRIDASETNNTVSFNTNYSGATSPAITFLTSEVERLRIFANGRIGINTTTDAGYQLDVNGTLRSVNGANFATTSGNVGIGTASPAQKLDVSGNMQITGGGNWLRYDAYGYFGSGSVAGGTTTDVAVRSENSIYFSTGGATEKMRLSTTGELIIGGASDAGDYKLQVSGNIYNTGSAVLAATSGNVGIGTASPLAVTNYTGLTLAGTNGSFTSLYTGASQIARIEVNTTSDFTIKSIANVPLLFGTNNTENARFNTGGELLINTTTDAGDYKLQVSGNALVTAGKLDITTNTGFGLSVSRSGTSVVAGQINNSNGILYYGAESSTGGGLFTGSSAYAAVIGSGAAYPLQFATDNVTRATINTNGELLINTLTDNGDYKLQVNGSALISGSIQTANPVSGTAVPWRLGSVVATNVQLDTGNYVEVNINGTFYRLAIVTPL